MKTQMNKIPNKYFEFSNLANIAKSGEKKMNSEKKKSKIVFP
jgi:hypothetical protein